ncbi:uncharacterized protein M6B38_239490 [Iris pallida]|uniref:DUF4228 domain protein n=1 Tax=Iris pallida TaxID=29817 RepID=A0AAX6DKU2_IRIPA|nr:uncharacterized protein M6B38_239490 [Iris pallida]
MKDSIRCCISCILPCGALDVIRIVHASGRVEEIAGGRTVLADEIMRAHPKHVLRKPPSSFEAGGDGPRAVVLPPDAELHRGNIYFLMPVLSAAPAGKGDKSGPPAPRRKKKPKSKTKTEEEEEVSVLVQSSSRGGDAMTSDRYLSEILSETASSARRDHRRRGRVGVWRPHLESISEIINND